MWLHLHCQGSFDYGPLHASVNAKVGVLNYSAENQMCDRVSQKLFLFKSSESFHIFNFCTFSNNHSATALP